MPTRKPRSIRWQAVPLASMVLAIAALMTAPTAMAGGRLEGILSISTGASNTCARLASGQARCWGFNEDGELGDGTTQERLRPSIVVNSSGTGPLTGVVSIQAGGTHTCSVLGSGRAVCSGLNNAGQLGDGSTDARKRPVTVRNSSDTGPLRDIIGIAPGYTHTCALLRSGQARCWGHNDNGQLGDGTTDDRHLPVVVRRSGGAAQTGIVAIAAGTDHTCALLGSGEVRCWGRAAMLGDGSAADRPLAGPVSNSSGTGRLTGAKAIDSGESSTCVLQVSGRVLCWGQNGNGQLGDGTFDPRPRPVRVKDRTGTGPLENAAQLSVGGAFACVQTVARLALCWGTNDFGELGDGTPEDRRPLPAPVVTASGPKLTDVAQVSAGVAFSCVRLTSGRARCWGDNASGYLGDGTDDPRLFPVFVVS